MTPDGYWAAAARKVSMPPLVLNIYARESIVETAGIRALGGKPREAVHSPINACFQRDMSTSRCATTLGRALARPL